MSMIQEQARNKVYGQGNKNPGASEGRSFSGVDEQGFSSAQPELESEIEAMNDIGQETQDRTNNLVSTETGEAQEPNNETQEEPRVSDNQTNEIKTDIDHRVDVATTNNEEPTRYNLRGKKISYNHRFVHQFLTVNEFSEWHVHNQDIDCDNVFAQKFLQTCKSSLRQLLIDDSSNIDNHIAMTHFVFNQMNAKAGVKKLGNKAIAALSKNAASWTKRNLLSQFYSPNSQGNKGYRR